jgi:hypothetical protein
MFIVVYHEESHTTDENRTFKMSLLHLLPFYHVIRNNFLGKFNKQQKMYFASKRKSLEYWEAWKGWSLIGNYLRNLMFFL